MYTAAPVTPELPEPQESKAGNQKNRKTQLINSLRLKYEKKKNYLTSRTVMKIVVNVPDKVGALIIEGKVFPFISSHLDPSNLIPSPHFSSLLSSLSSLLSSPLSSFKQVLTIKLATRYNKSAISRERDCRPIAAAPELAFFQPKGLTLS